MYGSQYVLYGATRACPRCAEIHPPREGIQETAISRFKLMQLMFELVYANLHNPGTCRQEDRMFGILTTPLRVYAAHSGPTQNGTTSFLTAACKRGYKICDERSASLPGRIDIRFNEIPAEEYEATYTRGGGYRPGACAAPRLIQQAILDYQHTGQHIDPTTWAMSEVMYKKNPTKSPAGDGQDWIHGLTAHSCETCARLVPLLLCTRDTDWSGAFNRIFG
ncbi:hypothetical protein AWB78_07336 [Caballeronia calidae]|uniref:Uncharacterized protein n=2 Tax=Caballeronia calidae TaxID=1777139 RepID=A0A158EE94_9BURK|nr:hypothetical protein AWB78_07336 [Caballeronia calidae]